jgi:hypothetical protein
VPTDRDSVSRTGWVFSRFGRRPVLNTGVTAMPPLGSGLVESFLLSLDAEFNEVIPVPI